MNKTNENNEKKAANAQQISKENEKNAKKDRKPRHYTADPNFKICSISLKKFKRLPADIQNTSTKKSCIAAVIGKHPELAPDATRFWIWVTEQTGLLKRTFDFSDTCRQLGLDEDAVAQHLVFEGKRVCTDVRLNGLQKYSGLIRMFSERLYDDPSNLFTETDPE